MININISVTSVDECIELMEKLKDTNIQVELKGAYYKPLKYTFNAREIRQNKILEQIKTDNELGCKRK